MIVDLSDDAFLLLDIHRSGLVICEYCIFMFRFDFSFSLADGKRTKILIYAAVAHMLLSMMAFVVRSRKRKRSERRQCISYGPMKERENEN